MRDIALDPTTGDLALDSHGSPHLTEGAEAVSQRLRMRLALWRGEFQLDTRVGIPYTQLLGAKNKQAALEAQLRAAASSCPGVAALTKFQLTVDSQRTATCSIEALASSGEPISLEAFQVAA